MIFGYVRVSTAQQNYDMQYDSLKTFGVDDKNIFYDKSSGAKEDRKGLQDMIMKLREGDTVIVWKMCRIARNVKHMLSLIEFFDNNNIDFKSIQEPFLDTTSPYGRFIFILFAALYQMERELNAERVVEGVKSAKKRGVRLGRPQGLSLKLKKIAPAVVLMHKDQKTSISKIRETFGISQGSIYRIFEHEGYDYKKSHKNKGNKNAAYKVKKTKAA